MLSKRQPAKPAAVIATLPIQKIVERVLLAKDATPKQVEALLGGLPMPELSVSAALEKFWEFSKDKTMNKSALQIRKWKNPRIKAVSNFIKINCDKEIRDVTRNDMIKLRDWWIKRVKTEKKSPESANKEFSYLRVIFQTVSDNMNLNLDTNHLFSRLSLHDRFKKKRGVFSTEQILTILQSPLLKKMNDEARAILFAAAETGMRPSEIVGLQPEDIRLTESIPYICIVDREERTLKTAHSAREIPLTGFALQALKEHRNGFPKYRDTDIATTTINKFLRENNLMPSERHTVYSLRHSFQDRILEVNAPDRVQAELMGHKFKRPKYRNGPTMGQKLEWMEKICLLG